MRLWSLHPRCLDAKGLVALWREGLLARAVLRGVTKGNAWSVLDSRADTVLFMAVGELDVPVLTTAVIETGL